MIILERDGSLVRGEGMGRLMLSPDHDLNQQRRRAVDLIERVSAAVGDRLRYALAGEWPGHTPGAATLVAMARSTRG